MLAAIDSLRRLYRSGGDQAALERGVVDLGQRVRSVFAGGASAAPLTDSRRLMPRVATADLILDAMAKMSLKICYIDRRCFLGQLDSLEAMLRLHMLESGHRDVQPHGQ